MSKSSRLEDLRKRLKPINEEIDSLLEFDGGSIEFYDARWVGEGSAEVTLDNGLEIRIDKINGVLRPFESSFFSYDDFPGLTESHVIQIKKNINELIRLRNKINSIMDEYKPWKSQTKF